MILRGWFLIGGSGISLPPMLCRGTHIGGLPDAAEFEVGQWIYWRPHLTPLGDVPTQVPVICVQIPL